MIDLNIGQLTLIPERSGGHIHVTVRGSGRVGQRPLCGKIIVTEAEWLSLIDVAYLATIARGLGEDVHSGRAPSPEALKLLAQVTR